MGRHPIDVLKAALQEAKTEAATLRIKTTTLAEERNVAILERNVARARVGELEQQNAVQRENVDEAMRQSTRLKEWSQVAETGIGAALGRLQQLGELKGSVGGLRLAQVNSELRQVAIALRDVLLDERRPSRTSDESSFRQPGPDALTRIRELEAEVQRLQRDRAQVGAFGFKPLGIR